MSRSEKERAKQIQDKCQNLLTQMLRDEDNKYCVDCDAKGPRWASWNLGIFLCIRCAGIHRNLGVHISKVKSVNLDSWTPEQVVSLQQMGNSRARAVYEANLPDSFRRPQTDCSLESFIRAKYEHKKYIAREWVPPTLPKVNWDKELDEEAERQRRRKKESQKSTTSQSSLPPVKKPEVVPQLPKPRTSASPKFNRSSGHHQSASTATAVSSNSPASSNTLDLLGLDAPESRASANGSNSGDDIFTSFLSAPPLSSSSSTGPTTNGTSATETNNGTSVGSANGSTVKSEEESFFNQPAPTPLERSKMTKDSIMALYATQPSQPFGGGMFNQQFQQQQQQMTNMGAFSQPLSHSQPSQLGMHAVNQMNVAANQMCMNPNQLGAVAANPMVNTVAMQAQMPGVTNSALQMQALGGNSTSGWSQMLTSQNLQPAPGSNPFLNLSAQQMSQPFGQLPQQMAQMSLGGMSFAAPTGKPASASIPGQTLSTNLWQ
ncbi:stromal membrane-associated protein 1 isoform X2 [Copidosoma floridanum]|uniref:stromal membrane-associated protein 1 isoform X2 n=1 Tax=Copidosoma floridanum TaxID=29053 RepID=UPI0006C9A197|nr:stromal membrane-associated protein 1 isoform X2 [Copidosoma floridanum]